MPDQRLFFIEPVRPFQSVYQALFSFYLLQHVLCVIPAYAARRRALHASSCIPCVQVRPFINEAHYYADATIMFPVWPPEQQSTYNYNSTDFKSSAEPEDNTQPRPATGWGLWLAQKLWQEVQWRCNHKDGMHAVHGPLPIIAQTL